MWEFLFFEESDGIRDLCESLQRSSSHNVLVQRVQDLYKSYCAQTSSIFIFPLPMLSKPSNLCADIPVSSRLFYHIDCTSVSVSVNGRSVLWLNHLLYSKNQTAKTHPSVPILRPHLHPHVHSPSHPHAHPPRSS